MNENLKKITDLRVEKTIRALEKNNMKGFYVCSPEELIKTVDGLVAGSSLMTSGGSMTLAETGLKDHLLGKYPGVYLDRADCKGPEEVQEYFRKSFYADVFFASTNAVTEQGELYNIDGNGNRVSAMIFGPKKVILVAGTNKIVSDMDEAQRRLEKIACPANTVRLGCETPCAVKGECMHCSSPSRICCSYVRLAQQRIKDRINVIFIEGSYGF